MGRKIALFCVLMLFVNSAHAAVAAVAVVVGLAAYGAGAVAATAIAIGLAAASAYMAFTMKVPSPKQPQQQLKQMLRSSRAPRNVWYGQGLVSGAMIFAEEQVGDDENKDGTFDEWLYMAVALCAHPIQAMDELYLNEEPSITFGNKLKYQLHNNSTTVDQYLLDNAPSWKSDMIGKGSTWLRLAMRFDRELFANGVPTPRVKYRGKNDIWDPRNNSYGYTNNAALIILDFHINYLGIPKDRMILSGFGSWKDAANLCDEKILNADGSTSKRYTIDGVFNLDEKPTDVINDMLASCGGSMVRMGGSYGLLPAAYNGPATFTITSSDIISDVTVQVEPATSDAINTVKGSFVDPKQGYVETDYPSVVDEGAKVRDGGELSEDLSLRFVTDVYQAQRLANILLRKSLTGGNVKFTANLNGAYARIGRVITLDIPESGIIGEYRVTSQSFDLINGVELELVREDIDIYDDAIGNVYVPPSLTNLPVGVIAAPSGVQFLVESIGEVVQGTIAWRINAPQSVSTDIRFKEFDTNNIVMVGSSIGNSFNVNSLLSGNYIVEVRSVTMAGRVSSWSTTSFIVDVPPMPDSVKVVASNWNILLTPNVTAGIPSGTLFEFRYLEDDRSYLTQSPKYGESDLPLSSVIGVASSYNHGGLTPDRWQHYWVRGTNSYGNSDWLYVKTGTLKEQDLVTTVVERLQAIEILSANWDEGNGLAGKYSTARGYKIFSPDPNDPTADGRAVFSDVYLRGDIYAKSLTFLAGGAIPDEINNSKVSTVKTYSQASKPTGKIETGSLWYDTANKNKPYRYNGNAWVAIQDGDIVDAKTEIATAKTEISAAKTEISAAKTEIDGAKSDIATAKSDITTAKSDIANAQSEIATTKSEVETTKTEVATTKTEVATAKSDIKTAKSDIATAKTDIAAAQSTANTSINRLDNLYPNQSNIQISSGDYVKDSKGWAIDSNGRCEFNTGVFRGTLSGADGIFSGTIYANQIIGNLNYYTAINKTFSGSGLILPNSGAAVNIISLSMKDILQDSFLQFRGPNATQAIQYRLYSNGGVSTPWSSSSSFERPLVASVDAGFIGTVYLQARNTLGGSGTLYVRSAYAEANVHPKTTSVVIS